MFCVRCLVLGYKAFKWGEISFLLLCWSCALLPCSAAGRRCGRSLSSIMENPPHEGWLLECFLRICCCVFLLGPSGECLWWKTSLLLVPLQSTLIFTWCLVDSNPSNSLLPCDFASTVQHSFTLQTFFFFNVFLFEERESCNKDNHGVHLPSWLRKIVLWFKNTGRRSCEHQIEILTTTWNNWGINRVLCQWEAVAKLNELENWPWSCFLKYVQWQVHCKFF